MKLRFLEHFNERQLGFRPIHRIDDLDRRLGHVNAADQRSDGKHLGALVLHHGEIKAQLIAIAQGNQRGRLYIRLSDSQESSNTTRLPAN